MTVAFSAPCTNISTTTTTTTTTLRTFVTRRLLKCRVPKFTTNSLHRVLNEAARAVNGMRKLIAARLGFYTLSFIGSLDVPECVKLCLEEVNTRRLIPSLVLHYIITVILSSSVHNHNHKNNL